jgi:capsular polysaccharide biosynthesis protein
MPIGDFFGVLRRRWLLLLIGFLMTVGLSGAAYELFKPTYEITGTVLLLPPPPSSASESANPYLRLGGLQQAVDLVGVALSDQATQLELKAISKDVEFTVQADVRTSSPLLVIDVKDSSPETALRIRDILVARVPVRLGEMQAAIAVNSEDRVTATVVTLDAQAVEVGKNRLRAAVVAACVGLGLTLVTATRWDARRLRRPRRKPARPNPEPDQVAPPPVEATVHPDEAMAGTPVEATVHPDEDMAGTPVSPASPHGALDPLEEPADAPDNAPH